MTIPRLNNWNDLYNQIEPYIQPCDHISKIQTQTDKLAFVTRG